MSVSLLTNDIEKFQVVLSYRSAHDLESSIDFGLERIDAMVYPRFHSFQMFLEFGIHDAPSCMIHYLSCAAYYQAKISESRLDLTRIFSSNGFYPFRVKPKVWLDRRFTNEVLDGNPQALAVFKIVSDAMRILNDALPPEFQLELAGPDDGDEGSILFSYLSPDEIYRECSGGVACSRSTTSFLGYTRWANIFIPDDLDASKFNTARTVIRHEFLHALGIQGHVDSIEFPDSLMGTYGDFFPNPGYVLHRIDREVLQIMYMSQRPDDYNDWGEWSDTTLHLTADSNDGHVHFGVALFNGLPQPWAHGTTPERLLSGDENPSYLVGSATWKGALLGFSGVSPVIGDAELVVDMDNLKKDHDLMFRDLTFANRGEETGPGRWFPVRNIDYKVSLIENGFIHHSTPEKDGHVIGVFLGPSHEGMAGTLKRTDLVGAFGGMRPGLNDAPSPVN